ncbi:hypothetical protein N7495_000669 [Penicillium taxi]|uniref:uncharacterized protein n=1 Tax=Penicillium taxi TaxID=168475 RepID=UPI0025452425|nr:uncharacterized protein N7495_000669 [Penicillium taxi]KAJ5907987.1 hypothetical protein N7495_000669 [Penicillium taxi]
MFHRRYASECYDHVMVTEPATVQEGIELGYLFSVRIFAEVNVFCRNCLVLHILCSGTEGFENDGEKLEVSDCADAHILDCREPMYLLAAADEIFPVPAVESVSGGCHILSNVIDQISLADNFLLAHRTCVD